MKVKGESEKVGLKLNIQKTKIMASGPITSWQIDGVTVEIVADFILLGSKITGDGDCSHEIKRCLLLGRQIMTNLDSILKSRDIPLPTKVHLVSSVQSLSRVQLFSDHSTPGLPVHHQFPEFTQTHVHWVGDAIQPSHLVVPFSSCPQSSPASGSFQMSQLFTSGSQSIGVSSSTSVLPMNTQDWYPLGWTGCLLAVQGPLKSFLQQHSSEASILWHSAL